MPNLRSKQELASGSSGLGPLILAEDEMPSANAKNLNPPEAEDEIAAVDQEKLDAERVLEYFARASNDKSLDQKWIQRFVETEAGQAVMRNLKEREASPEPELKRQKLATPPASESHALREVNQLLHTDEISLAGVDKTLAFLARAFEAQDCPAVKRLVRFTVTSTASHFPANWDRSAALRFKSSDHIMCELRAAVGLVTKLERPRGPANGGLFLNNILDLHAESAMQAAWRILADTCLAVKHAGQDDWWPEIIRNAGRFLVHARSVLGDEFALLVKLEGWLLDNTSPRADLNPSGDKLLALRDIVFPTDAAELGGEESFDAYGLRELDLGDFTKLNRPDPAPVGAPSPPQVLPEAPEEPQTQKASGPDIWIRNTLSRMSRDELLTGPDREADFFLNNM